MAEKKTFAEVNEEIAEKVTAGFNKINGGVVEGYKKVEDTFVGGYKKVEDAFVGKFLTHDGETVEEAKERLHKAEEARKAEQAQRDAEHKEVPDKGQDMK